MQVDQSVLARSTPRLAETFIVLTLLVAAAMPASAQVLDRIRETNHLRLGYVQDARPFAYRDETGDADGYTVALCRHVAAQVEAQLSRTGLVVDWTPVEFNSRLRAVQSGEVDVLCVPVVPTLAARKDVSFSISVFPGGDRAVIRRDSREALRTTLEGKPRTDPVWRGSPAATVLNETAFAVTTGTTTESWLNARRTLFQMNSTIVPVEDYRAGLQALLDNRADVFFGDRAAILGVMDEAAEKRLIVLDRMFTHEPYALPLPRDDEDFRLLVDEALSRLYSSPEFGELYAKWGGDFDPAVRSFFLWNTFPEHARMMMPSNESAQSPDQMRSGATVGE